MAVPIARKDEEKMKSLFVRLCALNNSSAGTERFMVFIGNDFRPRKNTAFMDSYPQKTKRSLGLEKFSPVE